MSYKIRQTICLGKRNFLKSETNDKEISNNQTYTSQVTKDQKEKSQQSIFCMYDKAGENYIHLFNTMSYTVLRETPFADLPDLINLQRKKGIKISEGKNHMMTFAEFICYVAITINNIKNVLNFANFFSTAEAS